MFEGGGGGGAVERIVNLFFMSCVSSTNSSLRDLIFLVTSNNIASCASRAVLTLVSIVCITCSWL